MRRHGTDQQRVVFAVDRIKSRDASQVDDAVRPIQSQLHGGNKRLPPGEQFCAGRIFQDGTGLAHICRPATVESVHLILPYSAAILREDRRTARQTACGVAGIAIASWPMASVIALITAAGAAIAPASPQPLMPSGFEGHGVFVISTSKLGRSSARGMQ